MKQKIIKKATQILVFTVLLTILFCTGVSAVEAPYATYTYDLDGFFKYGPHAYVLQEIVNSTSVLASLTDGASESAAARANGAFTSFNNPSDLFVDDLGYVYISDTGNNRIVVLDPMFNYHREISTFVNNQGIPDSLSSPSGLYVTDEEIFVCDVKKKRIVIFNKLGEYVHTVTAPTSDVMPENSQFTPQAVAVDNAGRIYVVSSTTNYGVLSINRDSSFNGFIGPQKVSISVWERTWRKFMSAEQLAASKQYVSTEYKNLTIDEDGFLYVTTVSLDEADVAGAIAAKSKSGDFAMVKKLNPSGKDVMRRYGFFPPAGDLLLRNNSASTATSSTTSSNLSSFIDVALGENGVWSVLDATRNRIFTYDNDGNLLYAFGEMGDQKGQLQNVAAIDYQGSKILVLDKTNGLVNVYKRTEYGDLINSAIKSEIDSQYTKTIVYYVDILQKNNNYDTAYIGIGETLLRNGDYTSALNYFKIAYDEENFSEAYSRYRKNWIEEHIWIVPLVIIVVAVGLVKFFGFINKYTKKGQKLKEKRSFWEEVAYGFHIIFHPFDGFWDLKHEKRGSVRGAFFWLGAAALVFIYQGLGQGYLLTHFGDSKTNFIFSMISIILPVLLWVAANWALTTLFDGEGSLKDVFIYTCYCLVPLVLLTIPTTIISNFVTLNEIDLLGMVSTLAWVWVGLLIFFGMMVTHDYTLGKNILTAIGSIVGVVFIMFIALLFTTLMQSIYGFFDGIYTELKYRYWM